jgi:hypothetical protein
MRRSSAPSIAPGTFFVAQSWADCITNMAEFNFRQPQVRYILKGLDPAEIEVNGGMMPGTSASGTFETYRRTLSLRMSANRRRAEASGEVTERISDSIL